jgi:phage-related minor tail protein
MGIPRFAEGGIVTGPTLALIGEAGPEAVIPLDRMSNGGGVTINVTGGLSTSAEIGESVVNALRAYSRSAGPLALNIA